MSNTHLSLLPQTSAGAADVRAPVFHTGDLVQRLGEIAAAAPFGDSEWNRTLQEAAMALAGSAIPPGYFVRADADGERLVKKDLPPGVTKEDDELARILVSLVLREEETAWEPVAQIVAGQRQRHRHEGNIEVLVSKAAERAAFKELLAAHSAYVDEADQIGAERLNAAAENARAFFR